LKHIEARNSANINKDLERKRKAAESRSKAKGTGINSANIKR